MPQNIAVLRTPFAGTRTAGFHWMSLQHPIADVDSMDILLQDDVARKYAVIQPVPEPPLCFWRVQMRHFDERTVVVCFRKRDFADSARMNAVDQFGERRSLADLESDFQAQVTLRFLADFEDALCTRNVHRHRLFAVGMFAGRDNRLQMSGMKIRWRRDYDRVQFL